MSTKQPDIGAMFGASGSGTAFLGFPAGDLQGPLEADIAIVGAPCATPYPVVGPYCAEAPAAIRAGVAGYGASRHHQDFDFGEPLLGETGARVVDCGDLPYDPEDSPGNRARIRTAVEAMLAQNAVPLVLGGDDSIPIPVFQAFEGRGPLTLLQVDAHIDWRDEVRGERFGLSSTMRRASEMVWIKRMVQVGARASGSARPQDFADAQAWGVDFFLAREVASKGIGPAIDAVPAGAEVLVSIDVDGLDPSIMPAVIGPSPGGLSYWQTVELLQGVAAKARIAGFCIVEFMPARDLLGLGALTAGRLVCNAIGLIARQAAPR